MPTQPEQTAGVLPSQFYVHYDPSFDQPDAALVYDPGRYSPEIDPVAYDAAESACRRMHFAAWSAVQAHQAGFEEAARGWAFQAVRVRDRLVVHASPLVRYVMGWVKCPQKWDSEAVEEIKSQASVVLMRAVTRYDPFARKCNFRTYAVVSLRNKLRDASKGLHRHYVGRERAVGTSADLVDRLPDPVAADPGAAMTARDSIARKREIVRSALSCLDAPQRALIADLYGLDGAEAPMTVKQMSELTGRSTSAIARSRKEAHLRLQVAMLTAANVDELL